MTVDHIGYALSAQSVPLHELNLDPSNVRVHPTRNLDAIKASLSKFGQRKPIVVQEQGMVVRAGNGTVTAARDLGWSHIAAVIVNEGDVAATAFALADNRTGETSEWDFEGLSEQLKALASEEFDVDQLGWSETEFKKITGDDGASVVDDPSGEWKDMPEFANEDQTGFHKIVVHFMTEEDLVGFAKLTGQKITNKTKSIWFPPEENAGQDRGFRYE